jgi:MFS family permease
MRTVSLLLGTVLTRYSTSLYNFLAPLMGPIFFTEYTGIIQLLLTYTASSVSTCARPVGTYLFGVIAKRYSPQKALLYSLVGIGSSTTLIGCIPGYMSIGWGGPFLLLCVKFLQGACAAGESMVTKLYCMENQSRDNALHVSYMYQSCAMLGVIISSGVATCIIYTCPYAWRVCFIISSMFAGIVYCMRLIEYDNNDMTMYRVNSYSTPLATIRHHKKDVLCVTIVQLVSHVTYTIPFIFMNSFVPLITDIPMGTMMFSNTFLLIGDMVLVLWIGRYCVRYHPVYSMMVACGVIGSSIIPLFYYMPGASYGYVLWGIVFLCPLNFWCNAVFTSSDKYFLIGIASACAAFLGSITTPLCMWLWYITKLSYAPALYIACIMMCCLYVLSRFHRIICY